MARKTNKSVIVIEGNSKSAVKALKDVGVNVKNVDTATKNFNQSSFANLTPSSLWESFKDINARPCLGKEFADAI